MGIRGFNAFIKKICPECITEHSITKYSNKILAIDASILLYKYRHISNISEACVNSHLFGFINRIKLYNKYNITPVFVFDGIPPEQKKITLKKRQLTKRKIYEKIEILQDITTNNEEEQDEINKEINKLTCQIINVTKQHIDDVKELLDILNIQYYDAPDEAEKYCVYLQKEKLIDYIVSDDTDVFTFGGYNVLKSSIKNNKVVEIDIDTLLEKLEYTRPKFIDFCILAGCDYLPYIPSLAINTVFTLFKKYDSIEDIMRLNKYIFTEEYNSSELEIVRNLFVKFEYDKINAVPEIKKEVNLEELEIFLKKNNLKTTVL